MFLVVHFPWLILKVRICLFAKGHKKNHNFLFHSSWKRTEWKLPEVRTISRTSALQTWKSISEFKPIAIPPYSVISNELFKWYLPRTERNFVKREFKYCSSLHEEGTKSVLLFLELCAMHEEQRGINLFRNLSVFKILGRSSGKSFTRHLGVLFSPGCSNCSVSLQISGQFYLFKDITWWPFNHQIVSSWRTGETICVPWVFHALACAVTEYYYRCALFYSATVAVVPQQIFVVGAMCLQSDQFWLNYYRDDYLMYDLQGWKEEK